MTRFALKIPMVFLFVLLILPSASVQAGAQPADSIIKAALSDLDKYEKEAEGLTPKHKANIKRISRMMPLLESRLNGSKNKSHPSWIEAQKRLQDLKDKLSALESGQAPGAAGSASAQSKGMSDQQIANKYNEDYKALGTELKATPVSKFAEPGILAGFKAKLAALKTLVGSFSGSANRDKFTAHYQKIEDYFNKKAAQAQNQAQSTTPQHAPQQAAQQQAQAQAAQPAAAQAGPLDYQNKRALDFFNKDYDRYLSEFDQVAQANKEKLTGYISRLENRLSKLTAKDHPLVKEAHQKVAALKAKMESGGASSSGTATQTQAAPQSDARTHKEFQKLYQGNRVALDFLDPAELSKPSEAKRWEKLLAQFEEIAAKFQNKTDPQVKADLDLLAEIRSKIQGGLSASTKLDLKSYPDFDQDMEFLKSLYDKYSATKIFSEGNEALAKRLLADYDKDKIVYDRLDQKYAEFIKGNQSASAPAYKQAGDLNLSFRNAGQWMDKFAQARDDYINGAGPRIEGILAKAAQMVDQAVKEKRPEWFTGGGIQHKLIQAQSGIDSLASIKGQDDPQVKALKAKYADLKAGVDKAEIELKDSILAATPLPADAYSGSDKGKIVGLALAEWTKKHPDKKPLAKGIAMPAWERRTEWRYKSVDGTRYKVDRSYLQVWVVIKTSETIATQYFIELSKNHLKGDAITLNVPQNLQGGVFKTEMLLKNVK